MVKIFRIITILVFSISFYGCGSIYFVGETKEPLTIYSKVDTTSTYTYTIPAGSRVLTKKKTKKYYFVIYENYQGYVYNPYYLNYHRYNSSNDGVLYGYSTIKPKKAKKNYYNNNSNSGGRVYVRGYYRKNGTYVRPHTRKSPSRRR